MARILLIAILAALQLPQSIAGTMILCMCENGSVCINSEKTCTCCAAEEQDTCVQGCPDLENLCTAASAATLKSDGCACDHLSLFAGESLKSVGQSHPPNDLLACYWLLAPALDLSGAAGDVIGGPGETRQIHPAALGATVLRC